MAFHKKAIKKITECVYVVFLPVKNPDGTSYIFLSPDQYLNDLWISCKKIAFIQTLILIVFFTMSLFYFRYLKLFCFLNKKEQIEFTHLVLNSKYYYVRMIGYVVKTQAIFSVLQDSNVKDYLAGAKAK